MTRLWSQKQSKLPCRNFILGTPLPGPQGPATQNCTSHFGHGAPDAVGRTPATFGERASAGPQHDGSCMSPLYLHHWLPNESLQRVCVVCRVREYACPPGIEQGDGERICGFDLVEERAYKLRNALKERVQKCWTAKGNLQMPFSVCSFIYRCFFLTYICKQPEEIHSS